MQVIIDKCVCGTGNDNFLIIFKFSVKAALLCMALEVGPSPVAT
jgi:hypothetical protein